MDTRTSENLTIEIIPLLRHEDLVSCIPLEHLTASFLSPHSILLLVGTAGNVMSPATKFTMDIQWSPLPV